MTADSWANSGRLPSRRRSRRPRRVRRRPVATGSARGPRAGNAGTSGRGRSPTSARPGFTDDRRAVELLARQRRATAPTAGSDVSDVNAASAVPVTSTGRVCDRPGLGCGSSPLLTIAITAASRDDGGGEASDHPPRDRSSRPAAAGGVDFFLLMFRSSWAGLSRSIQRGTPSRP